MQTNDKAHVINTHIPQNQSDKSCAGFTGPFAERKLVSNSSFFKSRSTAMSETFEGSFSFTLFALPFSMSELWSIEFPPALLSVSEFACCLFFLFLFFCFFIVLDSCGMASLDSDILYLLWMNQQTTNFHHIIFYWSKWWDLRRDSGVQFFPSTKD